jgi:hypothetical protein
LHEHVVLKAALPFCYRQLMEVEPSKIEQAMGVLSDYFPVKQEREWLVSYLGRCLSPHDGSKMLLCLTDSLGDVPGNSAKTTILNWLQSALGAGSCTIHSGQALTVGHSMGHAAKSDAASLSGPLIQCYDEVNRCNAKGASAQQINYGQL